MDSGEISDVTWPKDRLKKSTIHINFTNCYAISDINLTLKLLKKKKGITVIELSSNDIEDLKSYKLWIQEKLLPIRTDINKVPLIFSNNFGLLYRARLENISYNCVCKTKA